MGTEWKGDQPTKRVEVDGAAGTPVGRCLGWPRLDWIDRLSLIATIGVAVAATLGRLPPGICFGDAGGLQLAATTLGITHPPGYAGYSTVGFLASRVPGVDPAYLVTLAYWASGLCAVALCVLMQVRLGTHAAAAGVIALALMAHRRVWSNLVAPEVYMPSLALLSGAAYLVMRYVRLGARRDLMWAAGVYGFALANRPPVLFTLPFVLAASWVGCKRWEQTRRRGFNALLIATAFAALPGLCSVGYLWLRDAPETRYNYVDVFNAEFHNLPEAADGAGAKLERIAWLMSGAQFRTNMGSSWHRVRSKLRWLRSQLLPRRLALEYPNIVLAAAWTIVGLGAVMAYRRCPAAAWLLIGMIVETLVFICAYRIHGQSADLLPLLFAAAVLTGVAVSTIFPPTGHPFRRRVGCVALVIASIATLVDAPDRFHTGRDQDATSFVTEMDLATLPHGSTICTGWALAPPIWYAQYVLADRQDIRVINAGDSRWPEMVGPTPAGPVFSTEETDVFHGYTSRRSRNLWLLERNPPTMPDNP